MHPNHAHMTAHLDDPEHLLERRIEVARQSGVPDSVITRAYEARRGQPLGVDRFVEPSVDLVPGTEIETDLGRWQVYETPGHAPSHVTLHQPDRRLLLTGDHLLGRVSLYFDMGWTADPVGEFLESLDRVDAVDARLALAGHGRLFTDVRGHVRANRQLVHERLDQVRAALAAGAAPAYELAPRIYGAAFGAATGPWLFTKVLAYLRHLELRGEARRLEAEAEGGAERWAQP